MKTTLTIMASAMLMGTALTVSANPPAVPAPYGAGPLKTTGVNPPYAAPNLFKSEKSAFALLEAAMQSAEGVIYQGGCSAAAGGSRRVWDISTFVDDTGAGNLEISSNGVAQVNLSVVAAPISAPPGGTQHRVTGLGRLNGNAINPYVSFAQYEKTGAMMTQQALWTVTNVNNLRDVLTGFVIKDFYKVGATRPIPVIYDWGLQSVSKNKVPQDKWWQRSAATRSDSDFARTVFLKDRLFSAKNGGTCKISIAMSGTNDADLFDQTGTFTISK